MKLNVLFVNVPIMPYESIIKSFSNTSTIAHRLEMPLGLMYLSSYLKKEEPNHQVGLLDYSLYMEKIPEFESIDHYISKIADQDTKFEPDIIAFTASFSTSHRFYTEALTHLKTKWPNAVTIVGGNHASNTMKTLLENPELDYVARGEGEVAFTEFVRQIAKGQDIKVKGIYNKNDLDSGQNTPLCDYVEDMNDLPYPDWDLIEMAQYVESSGRKRSVGEAVGKNCATIMTSRGCVYSCTFCSSHSVFGRTMRYRSNENVIGEVKLLNEKYGVTLFIPEDDLFTVNGPRVISLLDNLQQLEIPEFELQFPNALSINTLKEDVMDALIRSGMSVACLAIESGNKFVQRRIIKKNCNLDKARSVVRYLKKTGIVIRCYYVLGFPQETKEQMMDTVSYAKSLESDWSAFSIATPLVGSEMYDELVEMKCIEDGPEMWSNSSYAERLYDTPNLSKEYVNDFAYRANLDVNFVNNYTIQSGAFEKALGIFGDITNLYPFHIFAWHCLMRIENGLGNFKKADEIEEKIQTLIKTDTRSADMFAKYGDLLQDTTEELAAIA